MRIISGNAKGRTLFAPPGSATRPTSDKIRGSLFNILGGRVENARVLDLFGGTGALALEAISRGAASAVIVDSDRAAVQVIERNARNVAKEDYDAKLRVIKSDYRSAVSRLEGRAFDLVFLDPPYRMTEAYGDALARLLGLGCLSEDCVAVLERQKGAKIALPEGFERFDERAYGDTVIELVALRRDGARGPEESISK